MANPRYEYHSEPVSITPTELRNDQPKIDEILNGLAGEGWVLDEAVRVDSSSLLFVFRRPVES
ncbi:hypothetical protein [Halopelagius fulvigenes]|uniref:DUF4177 domain-containing protein n=1 Tax=Halopelagius fulvigenes TaxID=1198324 RepID=A0ABD5U7S2_9EURY